MQISFFTDPLSQDLWNGATETGREKPQMILSLIKLKD